MAEEAVTAAAAESEVGEPNSCSSCAVPAAYYSDLCYSDAASSLSEASSVTFGTGNAAETVDFAVA